MPSIVYNSLLFDEAVGNVDFDTHTFWVMACGPGYSESKSHSKRSDVTNEITGTGYTAGGQAVTVTVNATDNVNNRVDITLGGASWPSSTLANVQKFVYYRRRGGAASADELVAVIDNGTPVSTTADTLTLTASTLRKQN